MVRTIKHLQGSTNSIVPSPGRSEFQKQPCRATNSWIQVVPLDYLNLGEVPTKMLQNGSEDKKNITSLKYAAYKIEEKSISTITNMKRGKKEPFCLFGINGGAT